MSDSESDSVESLQYKIILLGDGAVGKTSVCIRLTDDSFGKQYKQTLGLDFFRKEIILPGDQNVTCQIWDIGGQSISGKMIGNYIYGAHAVLLTYDITNYSSFQNLEDWHRLVRKTFEKEPMPLVALVGNKTDLDHLRAVKTDKHNTWAADNDMKSFFISAKTGDKCGSMLQAVAAQLAGVELKKADEEVATKVVKAEIVDHPTEDSQGSAQGEKKKGKKCVIQ